MTNACVRALIEKALAANLEGGREAVEAFLAGYRCAGKPTRIEPQVRARVERALVFQAMGWVGGRARTEPKRRAARRNAMKASRAAAKAKRARHRALRAMEGKVA